MSANLRRILIAGSILATVVLAAVWFMRSFERVEVEEDAGFTGEAASNPLYAAHVFLQKRDLRVHDVADLREEAALPALPASLFLYGQRATMGRGLAQQIRQWVASGGHLVLAPMLFNAASDNGVRDIVLEALGVQVVDERDAQQTTDAGLDAAPPGALDGDDGNTEGGTAEQEIAEVDRALDADSVDEADDFDDEADLVEAVDDSTADGPQEPAFDPVRKLSLPNMTSTLRVQQWCELDDVWAQAAWSSMGEHGAMLLQYRIGDGLVTVICDDSIFSNESIGDFDHAELLWRLAAFHGDVDEVWLVRNAGVPSILLLMWAHAWTSICAAMALLIFWLWRRSQRFGPILPLQAPSRRQLVEHLDATAAFLHKHQQTAALVYSHQLDVEARARRRIPGASQLSRNAFYEKLAEIAHLEISEVQTAMYRHATMATAQLIAVVQTLEKIRRAL